jgi:uncharacterized repeat protein (TIGR01451 family)
MKTNFSKGGIPMQTKGFHERHRGFTGLFLAAILAGSLGSGQALALVGTPGTANSSTGLKFNIDANLICGNHDGTAYDHDDWAPPSTGTTISPCVGTAAYPTPKAIFSGTGSTEVNPAELAAVRFRDPAFSSSDNIFGQGSKQDDTNTWVYIPTQKAPVKTDIGNVYALGRINATGNSTYAIMGFERLSANGDSHLDYELNQLPFVKNVKNYLVPNRCSGLNNPLPGCSGPDIIIALDDNTSKIPLLRIFKWVGSPIGGGLSSGSLGTFVEISADSTLLRTTNNPEAIAAGPWGTFNSKGQIIYNTLSKPNPILSDTFSEVSIDMEKTGINAGCPGGFGSLLIKSRSSESISSELKDRIDPIAFGLDTCGTMKIEKFDNSDPDNVVPLGGATFLISPNPLIGGAGTLTVTDGGVNDSDGLANGIITFTKAVPGTYTVTETVPPAGFTGTVTPQMCTIENTGVGVCNIVMNNHGQPDLTTSIKLANPVDGSAVVSGQTITYTIQYTNTGSAPALNTVITDVVDVNLTSVTPLNSGTFDLPTRTITWNVGKVGVGVTSTVQFTAVVVAPLSSVTIYNNAVLTYQNAVGAIFTYTTNTTQHLVGPPALVITKAVNKPTAAPSEKLVYTLSYSNTGTGDATNVFITDTLPDRTSFDSVTGGGVFDLPTRTITWNIGTLLHGAGSSVTFTVVLDSVFPNGPTDVVNSAVLLSTQLPPTPSNPVTTIVTAAADIVLSKVLTLQTEGKIDLTNSATISGLETPSGATSSVQTLNVTRFTDMTYTLTATNNGNANATNVVMTDTLPTGSTFLSASDLGTVSLDGTTVTWPSASLAALGGAKTVTLTIRVGQ